MVAKLADVPQRRIVYVNFAGHLLNAYGPNMLYPGLPNTWTSADWRQFIDMVADFGLNVFEFWLVPRLFCRHGLKAPFGRAFIREMNALIDHAHRRGVAVELLASLSTVGTDWITYCPRDADQWSEIRHLWDQWTRALPELDIVAIFPGDPGGCSRNGCTAETYIDASQAVAEIIVRNIPDARIDLGTWGPPFFGWGNLQAPPDWRGEFLPHIQASAWSFDRGRAQRSMEHLLRRLPDFSEHTAVSINLGFNGNGDPVGDQDARPWARRIASTHRILTWDYSLTEGENVVLPHYRFERLFRRRREEREAAPYTGGICYTKSPLINQLSLYQSARSFAEPHAEHATVARAFFERLYGPDGAELAARVPLFEVVPDWGNEHLEPVERAQYHAEMLELVDVLHSLRDASQDVPFHPSPERYRLELLFFATLFADLTSHAPDYDALRARYWGHVYGIYDHLPQHVDPRPKAATDRLIAWFADL